MSSTGASTMNSPGYGKKALYACFLCRRQKKGCDKVLPSCSACSRLHRVCRYDTTPSSGAPESIESLSRRVANLEQELSEHRAICGPREGSQDSNHALTSNSRESKDKGAFLGSTAFPSVFFLDVNVFRRHRLKAPKPQMTVQDHIFKEIGSDMEIRAIVGAYFFSISTWLPIVSRKQFYQELSDAPLGLAPDVALLILCMKLVIDKIPASHNPRTMLYAVAKNFFLTVESSGVASMKLLQAGILLCLYETGHAIYPQAYISIGHIGRLGQAIGLHDTTGVPQLALEPGSWEEMEERRRVWWAVYILDRHMNIGNPSRSLALAETGRREFLPVDDKAWEEGEKKTASEPLFVSSSTNIAAAPFARLGQASHLLSLVLTHINDTVCDTETRLEEARQLRRALLALCSFLRQDMCNEITRICVPVAICYSALITLYENASKGRQSKYSLSAEIELRELGISGLQSLVPMLAEYALHIQTIISYNLDQASPLIANCLYRMAVSISEMTNDSTNQDYLITLNSVKETLSKLSPRWNVAEEYLEILEDFELTALVEDTTMDSNEGPLNQMFETPISFSSLREGWPRIDAKPAGS